MSLGAVWAGPCSDGRWYEEPSWNAYNEDGGRNWFVCLDEDDPAELVVRVELEAPELSWFAHKKLKESGRCCLGADHAFLPAKRAFGGFVCAPPPPNARRRDLRPGNTGRSL